MEIYIARDKDNSLSLCNHKQEYDDFLDSWEQSDECINDDYGFRVYIPENLFPEVKFENSPMRVELKLIQDDK